ncbi:unnamed protein product [Ilex paraguariensis]|uniref:CCHC-type domain-containing protein n=1 Tax=Ilex paraguariensis TaxID=185542 RepID=A0ABC8V3V9_9AQUA
MHSLYFWMPMREAPRIQLRYQSLENFCYRCGIIGHEKSNCIFESPIDKHTKYNQQLRASPWKTGNIHHTTKVHLSPKNSSEKGLSPPTLNDHLRLKLSRVSPCLDNSSPNG